MLVAKALPRRNNVLKAIKESMDKLVGQPIMIKANRGRKKVLEVEGVLEQTYPKIFVVKLQEDHLATRLSYTYTDILTKTVEIQVEGRNLQQQLKANA